MRNNLLSPRLTLLLLMGAGLNGCGQDGDPGSALDNRMEPVARAILRGEDKFQVSELTEALIERRQDLLLMDLRPAERFEAEHIEAALNVPLERLLSQQGISELPAGRMLVLYTETTTLAAQAAALLRLAGKDAYALEGGFQEWLSYTTDPAGAGQPGESAAARAERQAVACYFQGDYVAAAGLAVRQGGYTPPVTPVGAKDKPAAKKDTLGLGLGLGLGPTPKPQPKPEPEPQKKSDNLGLGLGLGLGPPDAPKPAPQEPPKKPRLIIGEGC
jgi:rhodanese-related sulfurtransferase